MKPTLFLLFIIPCFALHAQDVNVHFSQFYFTPMHHNPALTGIFKGDIRATAVHRRQWQSVPVPYLTFGGSMQGKMEQPLLKNTQTAFGFTVLHDEAGDAALSISQLQVQGSVAKALNPKSILSVGFQFGAGQRAFDPDRFRFGSQYDGEQFNPDLPGESFEQEAKGYFSLGAGLNWHIQESGKWSLDLGAAWSHLNRPAINFTDQVKESWDMLTNTYAMGTYRLGADLRLRTHALARFQGNRREIVGGAGIIVDVNQQSGSELAIGAGLSHRLEDALIPYMEVHYRQWTAGLSFDFNTSEFRNATSGNGGPEIVLQYTFTRVKPIGVFESCPIF